MKILHTSDWHLGRTLHTKNDCQDEHSAFLEWLINTHLSELKERIATHIEVVSSGNGNSTINIKN